MYFVGRVVSTVVFGSDPAALLSAAPAGLANGYIALRRALIARDAAAIAEGLYLFGIQYNIARPPIRSRPDVKDSL
jgi:hypothetical protein